jgi:hypothetical protein
MAACDFDLNIGDNANEHLTKEDGIQELLTNAFDEHKRNKIDTNLVEFTYDDKANQIIIVDYGRGITLDNFLNNSNRDNKESNQDAIGQFGYGLKDAISVLYNPKFKKSIEIMTNKHIFTPKFKNKVGTSIKSIHIKQEKNKVRVNFGTKIVLYRMTQSIFDDVSNRFANLCKNKCVQFSIGDSYDIYVLEKRQQKIFMNGCMINSNPKYHFSYNMPRLAALFKNADRDRNEIDMKIIKPEITKILKKIDYSKNNEFLNLIVEILKTNDKNDMLEFNSVDVVRAILCTLNHTGKYIFLDKTEINKSDKTPIVIGDFALKMFCISSVKELYNLDCNFYTADMRKSGIKRITTSCIHDEVLYVCKQQIEKILSNISECHGIKIPQKLSDKLMNIEISSANDVSIDESYNIRIPKAIAEDENSIKSMIIFDIIGDSNSKFFSREEIKINRNKIIKVSVF